MVRQVFGIMPDAPNERGSPSRLPWQSQKVDPRLSCNAALMRGLAIVVERGNLQPAVVNGKACCPDDRGYSRLLEIQLENELSHAARLGFDFASFGLLGKV